MSQAPLGEILARFITVLNEAGVEYMLVGSVASSVHGEPRSTQDFDIVIERSIAALERLLGALDPEVYYFDPTTARQAYRRSSQFNVLDVEQVWKFDVIFQGSDAWSREAFLRRSEGEYSGVTMAVLSPEDAIVSKLRWAERMGGSERQLRDVAGIVRMRSEGLDYSYLEDWLSRLGLKEMWAQVQGEGDAD